MSYLQHGTPAFAAQYSTPLSCHEVTQSVFESKSVEMIFFIDQETKVQGNGEPFLKTMPTSMNPDS